jgi:large subunit ribosomal protein L1
MSNGKKYQEKVKLVDRQKLYSLNEALALVKQTARTKFDETVDVAMKLGVDAKKVAVRGTVMLPAGSGKTKKVAVIAKPEKALEAEKAGADVAGGDDLIQKIQNGFLGFDVVIATPDMMGAVGKLGKILGTKGLMPNPKAGTVTFEIEKAVKEFKAGKTEFKMDKGGALHSVLGKVSFGTDALAKNFNATLEAVLHAKPAGTKGVYVESITLSSTMGPGVKIDRKVAQEMAMRSE